MKKGIVAIGIGVVGVFCLPFASLQAATNSWINTDANPAHSVWTFGTSWSLSSRPLLADNFDFITNSTSKTITINQTTTTSFQDSLAITNLIVSAPAGTTNILFLNNAATNVPLHIFNGLTVGSGGALQITNSFLQVNITNGTFQLDGTLRTYGDAKVQARTMTMGSGAVLEFALGTNSSPIIVNSNLTVAGTLNVTNGAGFTATTYTLFTYGGSLINNGLTLGTTPTNFTCSIDTSTLGLVKLTVSAVAVQSPTLAITSISSQTNDILITWSTSGAGTTNAVQATSGTVNGSYSTDFTDISSNIIVTGATSNYTDVGGATNTPSRFYRVRLVP